MYIFVLAVFFSGLIIFLLTHVSFGILPNVKNKAVFVVLALMTMFVFLMIAPIIAGIIPYYLSDLSNVSFSVFSIVCSASSFLGFIVGMWINKNNLGFKK